MYGTELKPDTETKATNPMSCIFIAANCATHMWFSLTVNGW